MSLSNGPFEVSQLPALQPPPGVVPNFDDPHTRGPLFLVLSAIAIGVMYFFVTVRFYTKLYLKRNPTWDDLTCAIATLALTGLFIGIIFLERAGMGANQWDVRAIDIISDAFLKPLYILVNLVPIIALFTKLSFFIIFFQIFGPKQSFRWTIIATGAITTIFYITVIIILFVLSTPKPGVSFAEQFVSFLAKKTSPVLDTTFALGYFNIFSDLYILILPISGVARLNLRRRRKIGVYFIFATGSLTIVASSLSLYYRYRIQHSGNSTWHLMPASYFAILEYSIGIDCSCVPACSVALFRHLPLLQNVKVSLTSRLRSLNARLGLSSRSSRSPRLVQMGDNKGQRSSDDNEKGAESNSSSGDDVAGAGAGAGADKNNKNLPKISKGGHRMLTARAFIWGGSRKHSMTTTTTNTTATAVEKESNGTDSITPRSTVDDQV